MLYYEQVTDLQYSPTVLQSVHFHYKATVRAVLKCEPNRHHTESEKAEYY